MDAIRVNDSIVQCIRGSYLIDVDEIMISEHRGFFFSINNEEYFDITLSFYDKSETPKLNPNKRKCENKFCDKLEEYVDQMKLIETANRVCANSATVKELKRFHDAITCMLSATRSYAEGSKRNALHSRQK